MKNLINHFFYFVIIITLTSCSSDSEYQDLLLGRWDLQKIDIRLTTNGQTTFEEIDFPFKQNGSITQYSFRKNSKVEYYLFTPESEQSRETEEFGIGTYIKSDDELLTLNINTENKFKITLLNSKNLHLTISKEDTFEAVSKSYQVTRKFVKLE